MLSRVSRLVGFGVLVGVGVSVWASKFVASLLYGIDPRDPATLVGAAVVLAAVGALAGWWPAWRASRIERQQSFETPERNPEALAGDWQG